jgi:hypothetical protein
MKSGIAGDAESTGAPVVPTAATSADRIYCTDGENASPTVKIAPYAINRGVDIFISPVYVEFPLGEHGVGKKEFSYVHELPVWSDLGILIRLTVSSSWLKCFVGFS